MRIAVLGPLEVLTEDSTPVPLPGAKERLLLAVLVAGAPAVVPTDRLVDLLWDGHPPATARKSLQAHLVRLRSSLEPDRPKGSTGRFVVRRGSGYVLAVDRSSIDSLSMTDLAVRGQAELASGHVPEAARDLRRAVELWRGEPYADWPDARFVEGERRRLAEVRAGALEGLLEAELRLGRHADVLPELERLVAEEPLREGWWRLLMLAQYRAGRQADALATGRRVRAVLAEELGADPGPRLQEMEAAILAQDPALEAPDTTASPDGRTAAAVPTVDTVRCPYKGLATYQAADAALFHGRARMVDRLVARLVDAPVLVVSGPSGAGKSSVVRAGLIPALAAGALPGSETWRAVVVVPGRAPVDALAPLTGDPPPASPVVLVCDQFEELWAPGVDPSERTAFLDAVLGLLDDNIVVRCVAVVRGDHVGRLAEHAAFIDRLGTALVLVPALTDDELREVVQGPAVAVGLTTEPELLDTIVADVLGRPGALPLLSTALVGTWARRRGDRLTLAGYLEAGGVAGALTRSAEDAYAALDQPGRELARRLLVRLADVDDGGALVRRPVPLAELDLDGEGGAERREVVEAFVDRRLLSLDRDRLEVAHEALLTGWPRLASWLEDDAAGRVVRRQLAPSARAWADGGRPDEELYRGARLAAAVDWAAGADADLTPVERQFLDASQARADAELTEARDRAHREAAGRRRTRRLAIGLAAVLVVALVAAGLAARSQMAAERASRAAERASLVADANRLATSSPTAESMQLSYLLAAQGFRLAETPETQDALLTALVQHRRVLAVTPFRPGFARGIFAGGGRTLFLAFGPQWLSWTEPFAEAPRVVLETRDSGPGYRTVAGSPRDGVLAAVSASQDGPWLVLIDADGGVRPLVRGDAPPDGPAALSFTADGRHLVLLVAEPTDGGTAAHWRLLEIDVQTGTRRDIGIAGTVPAPPDHLDLRLSDPAGTAVISAPGFQSAPGPDTPPGTLVDLTSGRQTTLRAPPHDAANLGYVALPSGAAQAFADGAVTLYDRAGRVAQELEGPRAAVNDVALAPDGTWAATAGFEGEVLIWDVDPTSGRWSQRESLQGQRGTLLTADIDGTGTRLATVSTDYTAVIWDMGPDGGFGASTPGLTGRWIANRPEVVDPGRLVVAPTRPLGSAVLGDLERYAGPETREVAATFIDVRTGAVVDQVVVGDTVEDALSGSTVAVSPDRRRVAVTSGRTVTVLDARTRQEISRVELDADSGGAGGPPAGTRLVCCAVWTPDGTRLLLGAQVRTDDPDTPPPGGIVVVDTATWEPVRYVGLDISPEALEPAASDGPLAVASADSTDIVLLDVETLEEIQRVTLSADDRIYALSFSPDGRLLVGAGVFGTLHAFDTRTWEGLPPAKVTDGAVLQIEWLPDDRTAVAVGEDGTISLFDVRQARERAVPLPAAVDGRPARAYVVPDPDTELVALGEQRAVLRYPMDPSLWLREACGLAGRDLTRAEWDRYLPDREYRPTCSDLG